MLQKVKSVAQVAREKFDRSTLRLSVGAGLLAGPAMAFAQTDPGTFDTTESLAKIAAGVAAAVAISVAMTAAIIGIKSSKLPRRGA